MILKCVSLNLILTAKWPTWSNIIKVLRVTDNKAKYADTSIFFFPPMYSKAYFFSTVKVKDFVLPGSSIGSVYDL